MSRFFFASRKGARLTASAASFASSTAQGAAIASLSHPFGGGESYAVVGTVPGQLALSGDQVVRGAGAVSAGASYAVKVRAISADGKRELAETLGFAVQAGLPALGPNAAGFIAGAPAGTLIAPITGVPAGATPAFAPADGRVAIAGSEGDGWKLVVGITAASIGPINGTIAAPGATSGAITVSANAMPITFASSYNPIHSGNAGLNRAKLERWPHYFPKAVGEVQFAWNNWIMYSNSTGPVTSNPNVLPITSAVAECNGVAVALTFDGSATRTLAIGENDVRCQTLTPSMFGLGGTTFPAGTVIWTKIVVVLATVGEKVPWGGVRVIGDVSGSQSLWYDPAVTTIGNATGAGTFTSTGTAPVSQANGMPPMALGRLASYSNVWIFLGDSISEGIGDTAALRDGKGWANRVMSSLGLPSGNLAVSGSNSASGSTDARYAYWFALANRGHVFYGTNDFNPAGTSTASITIGRLQAILARLRASGTISKVGASKLLVKRDSSNQYIDEAGQSAASYAGWVPAGPPSQVNDAIDAMGFDYVLSNNSVRGVTDPFNWRANGTTFAFARDFAHPSNGGHAALATEAQPILAGQ